MKTALIAAIVSAVVAAASGTAATLVVTSKNIKNGTIQAVDISAKAKRALRGNRGPRGLPGPQGSKGTVGGSGPAGPQGPPGVQSITSVRTATSVPPNSLGSVIATCPAGQAPISGGFVFGGIITVSNRGSTGWSVGGLNDLSTPQELVAIAYCSPNVTGFAGRSPEPGTTGNRR